MIADDALLEAAREVATRAYAPYSGFRVGAALVGDDGRVHVGANVENAAYSSGACAEATAIGHAVSMGVRRVETIAVACIDAEGIAGAVPCGHCLQVMGEFGVRRVLVTAADGSARAFAFDELLPHPFEL